MNYVAAADWLVILVYLVGIIALGVACGRGQHNTRDYFLGSKNVPWWGVGLSIVATETSALTFIGVPAMAYGADHLTFLQIVVGYVLARIVLAVLLVPHYFRGEIYSPYQLLGDAFGRDARRTVGAFFLLAGVLAAGVRVYVTCIPLRLLLGFGEAQILWAIVLFVGLSLIYTYVGGVKAVIWTDAVQFLLFLAGGLYALWFIPTHLGGGWSAAMREADAAGKLHWLNPSFSLAKTFNLWMGVIGATFQVMSSHGADQLIVQRVLTCRNVSDGRKSLILSAVIIFPLFLLFLLIGTLLWVYYQHHPMAIPLPEARPGIGQFDYVFPIFIFTVMPVGVKGFLIVAILSAAMSSVSSALSALASVATMDFLKRDSSNARDEAFYLRRSKQLTLVWAGALVLVAWLTQRVESVLNAAFSLTGLTSGAMLGGLLLAIYWKHGRSAPVVIGMFSALATMIALRQFAAAQVAWPWYTLIGTVVTVAVAMLVRRLMPPSEYGSPRIRGEA